MLLSFTTDSTCGVSQHFQYKDQMLSTNVDQQPAASSPSNQSWADLSADVEKKTSRVPYCRFFAAGNCRFSPKCRFRHDLPDRITKADDISVMSEARTREPSSCSTATTVDLLSEAPTSSDTSKPAKTVGNADSGRPCRYFRYGQCQYDDHCRFSHVIKKEQNVRKKNDGGRSRNNSYKTQKSVDQETGEMGSKRPEINDEKLVDGKIGITSDNDSLPKEVRSSEDAHETKTKISNVDTETKPFSIDGRFCRNFNEGRCRYGKNCRFIHHYGIRKKLNKEKQLSAKREAEPVKDSVLPAPADVVVTDTDEAISVKPNSRQEYKMDQLTDDDLTKLRQMELRQLQKRYPRAQGNEMTGEWSLTFCPSDPDWPYDVRQLDMVITLPETYPLQPMLCDVSQDQSLPSTLALHLQYEMKQWITNRHSAQKADGSVQLMFRPFLLWLDRELERLFTEGLTELKKELLAQAAGLQFIPHWKLRKNTESQENTKENIDDANTESQSEDDDEIEDLERDIDEIKLQEKSTNDRNERNSVYTEPDRKGTEIKIRQLQVLEHTGTLIANKIRLTVQCVRCKSDHDVLLAAQRLSSKCCHKCHFTFLINYRPAMMHQYSDIVGYLDLEGCAVVDLILADCEFTISCANCSKVLKKQNFTAGAVHDTRCHGCHGRLRVAAGPVRFFQLEPALALDVKKAQPLGGARSRKTDVIIQQGHALPDEGICKHFKKSFRWFRFPCCGKLYPCDHCHEEKKTDGHEMAWATRMICGHCSTEQIYSAEKPCIACQNSLNKSTGSAFWEGGKGCRDKIKMSRNDDKKYQNVSKTISKSTQKKSDQQKRTKPRHT